MTAPQEETPNAAEEDPTVEPDQTSATHGVGTAADATMPGEGDGSVSADPPEGEESEAEVGLGPTD